MKKVYAGILLLAAILIVFVYVNNANDLPEETHLPNKQMENNSQESNESNELISNAEDELKINNIFIFDTTYEQLIATMGEPTNVTKIEDQNIVNNYGYFSILSYEGLEFTINSNNDYDLTNGVVTEIDIIGPCIFTTKGITINDTKEKVKSTYSIENFYPLETNNEEPIPSFVIKGIKRDEMEVDIDEYDEYCYIQSKDKPIALIFLLKKDVVKRIVLRHLTAG